MSAPTKPKISIVVPSFNQGQYIEDTITSVLDQGYPETELFVFDAGSKDGTVEVLKKYDKHITFWASEPDKGHTDAINKGLRRATGQILAYLNSDDFFLPNAFHAVAEAYAAHPDAGLYTGNGLIVDGRKENARQYMREIGYTFESMLRGSCYLLQPSSFVNRKAWDKLGEFDDTLKFAMDLDYWLRVAREYEVVFIDGLLSAWRMHEDIKTAHGGFVRWTELWRIYRKFTKDQITPGLLVELFSILQHPLISEQLGMDIKPMAQQCFHTAYTDMQKALNLRDCIPVGKGNIFRPTAPNGPQPFFRAYQPAGAAKTAVIETVAEKKAPAPQETKPTSLAPAIFNRGATGQPRIDLVLQATGAHAWAVGGGWEVAARKLGCLHRVFRARAPWGATDVAEDDGLFAYLANPQADILFLAGFDWHSQPLHASARWQERWLRAKARKVLYVQESVLNHEKLSGTRVMEDAFRRAAALVDAIIYTDLSDRALMESMGKPVLFQPFGVDDDTYVTTTAFSQRAQRAFFRGKHQPFAGQTTSYNDRRALIQFLLDHEALDMVPYQDGPVTPQGLAADFNRYQVAVNFPSVFSNHPTRVYEAMACGCAVVTNKTGVEEIDRHFEHGKNVFYYTNREEMLAAVRELTSDPAKAAEVARAGEQHVKEHHALHRRLTQAMEWLAKPETVEAMAPKAAPTVAVTGSSGEKRAIVVDGVIFDLQRGSPHGISRVWHRLLEKLAKTPLGGDIVLLDRAGTAPEIPGIRKRPAPGYNFKTFEDDSLWTQTLCDQENAALFVSTYHTYAEKTPTVVMLHDLIPELTGQDLSQPEWRAKDRAIRKSIGYFSVSQSTANDFRRFYPQNAEKKVYLTPNAVGDDFHPRSALDVRAFREKFNIRKPYFLLVGHRSIYKNAILFFRAFSMLPNREEYDIICAGGATQLEPAFRSLVDDSNCHLCRISDANLSTAYAGAVALVYPSRYEGFGLPILEAQKCGCPVITCCNSSIPEVAGEAVIYIDASDVGEMKQALIDVQRQDVRNRVIEAGKKNVARFSWCTTAETVERALGELRELAGTLPAASYDTLDTLRRLNFVLMQGGLEERELGISIRETLHYYATEEGYDRDRVNEAEAQTAVAFRRLMPKMRTQFPAPRRLDGPTAFVLGLEAQARQDWRQSFLYYAHALQNAPVNAPPFYNFRLALRLARVAAASGDTATAQNIEKQILQPTRASVQKTMDMAAEEAAIKDWDEQARALERRQNADAAKPAATAPLVSVIVSTYNSERFLRGCLEDLEEQTIAHRIEIIVVDSASPQNERAIVEEFQKRHSNIVYIRTEERETVYGAWNRGIKAARGKYVTNANTDDRHRRDALEILARTLEANSDITLAYADCRITQTENETFDTSAATRCYHWLDFSPHDLVVEGCFCGPQPMWRREVHNEYGYFDDTFVSAGDYEFWLKIARGRKFLHVREILGLYLESPGSVEHRNAERAAWEVQEARRRHGPKIIPGFRVDTKAAPASEVKSKQASAQRAQTIALPAVAKLGNLTVPRDALRGKQYRTAWNKTIEAIAQRPFHPEAYLLLAEIALATRDGNTARQCAERAKEMAPNWAAAKKFLKGNLGGQMKTEWMILPARAENPRLSVCLIVKNEEEFLGRCLASVKDVASQIVVLDTGSADRTVEIAKEFGAEVHSFAWSDDFSAARNAALERATGDWILSLDADEELLPEHKETLRREMQEMGTIAFRLPIIDKGREEEGCSYVPRLFRNAPGLFFLGRVHEQVFSSVQVRAQEWGLKHDLGKSTLLHHGYLKEVVASRNKVERNLKLLELAIKELPNEPNLLMSHGAELIRAGQTQAGLERYFEALRCLGEMPAEEITPEMRETLLTQFTHHLLAEKRFDDVVNIWQTPAAKAAPQTASQHFGLGLAQMELKQPALAAEQMRQCLNKRSRPTLSPVNKEILKGGPSHCLALCLAAMEQPGPATEAFQAALSAEPKSRVIRLDYARFLGESGKPLEALKLLNEMASENGTDAAVWELGGQVALSKPEFREFACDWTGEAVKNLGDRPAILAQRAEALLMAERAREALLVWGDARLPRSARFVAAQILCETLLDDGQTRVLASEELETSQEALKWYRRMIAVGAKSSLQQLHQRLEKLRNVLPSFVLTLEKAHRKAAASVPAPAPSAA